MWETQQACGRRYSGQVRPKLNHKNTMCGRNSTLQIALSTPHHSHSGTWWWQQHSVVRLFIGRYLENRSGLRARWMEPIQAVVLFSVCKKTTLYHPLDRCIQDMSPAFRLSDCLCLIKNKALCMLCVNKW